MKRNKLYQEDIKKITTLNLPWQSLNNKKVLITGASGLIGTVIVDVLMYRNLYFNNSIEVMALGRNAIEANDRFDTYMSNNMFKFIKHDINNSFDDIEKADYVIHCASNTHPNAYSTRPIETITTCVNGTMNVLDYIVSSNAVRSVFLSSVEVYGENRGNVEAFSEKDMGYIDCNTLRAGYPEGKRMGEALCNAYIKEHNININIARLCRIFGPTMRKDDSKAIAQFLNNALKGEDIVLKSEGTQEFSYLYVIDAVAAIFTVLFNGKNGEVYNISDKFSDISLKDLATIIATTVGKKVVFDVPNEVEKKGFSVVTKALLDSTKLGELEFKTFYNIKEAVERTLTMLQ